MMNETEVKEVFNAIKYYAHGLGYIRVYDKKISGYEPYIGDYSISLTKDENGLYLFFISDGDFIYKSENVEGLLKWFDYVYSHRRQNQVENELFRHQLNKTFSASDLTNLPEHVTDKEKEELAQHLNSNTLNPKFRYWCKDMNDFYHFWLVINQVYATKDEVDERYKNSIETGEFIKFSTGKIAIFNI